MGNGVDAVATEQMNDDHLAGPIKLQTRKETATESSPRANCVITDPPGRAVTRWGDTHNVKHLMARRRGSGIIQ